MHKFKLRSRLARAASIGVVAAAGSLILGAAAASAAPADPPGGATPVAPHFYNGNVEGIRDTGSDTTFFMMQKIGDLYTGAGLYGCTVNGSAGQTLYNTSDPASISSNLEFFCQANQNVSTTDVNDNWDRTEVTEGVDDVGSGAGQNQLCNALSTPLTVDFARSSKPAGSACGDMVQTGYAKDGVPVLDYPINPSTFGTSSAAPYNAINGGVVGPVTQGWLPGDSPSGPYSGTHLTNVSNADGGGGAGSTAYRLWCATDATRISDWGQLTNLGPALHVENVTTTSGSPNISLTGGATFPSTVASGDAVSGPGIPVGTTVSSLTSTTAVLSANATSTGTPQLVITTVSTLAEGAGMPVGIPVRIMGVNTASGTEATFASYAASGVSGGGGCSASMNSNAATDPNSATDNGTNAAPHVALENNSDQINEFAAGDWPGDTVDQAIEASTTLYIESNGVYNTNPYAAATTIGGTSFTGFKLNMNGVSATTPNELGNTYPTARTLFNIYRTSTIRASTGGFLNWICDGGVNFAKGLDNSTGKNFDTELTTIIATQDGFPRLTDESAAASIAIPADGLAAPNNSCAATFSVSTTSGSNVVTLASGNFPIDIPNAGGLVGGGSVGVTSTAFPSGTTVTTGSTTSGTTSMTLNQNATATGTETIVLSGVPAVTAVTLGQT